MPYTCPEYHTAETVDQRTDQRAVTVSFMVKAVGAEAQSRKVNTENCQKIMQQFRIFPAEKYSEIIQRITESCLQGCNNIHTVSKAEIPRRNRKISMQEVSDTRS